LLEYHGGHRQHLHPPAVLGRRDDYLHGGLTDPSDRYSASPVDGDHLQEADWLVCQWTHQGRGYANGTGVVLWR